MSTASEKEHRSCERRIEVELRDRVSDLRRLWKAYRRDEEGEEGALADCGLCFDYVPAGTFDDHREGYFRYQLSWGGPSDEFRFFVNPDLSCHRVEYWFLDWFDGAHRILSGANESLLLELWGWFEETVAATVTLCHATRRS